MTTMTATAASWMRGDILQHGVEVTRVDATSRTAWAQHDPARDCGFSRLDC